jgi:hypothetical protein
MHTRFQLENLKGRDHLEDLGTDGKIMDLRQTSGKAWNGCIWLRIGTNGRFL